MKARSLANAALICKVRYLNAIADSWPIQLQHVAGKLYAAEVVHAVEGLLALVALVSLCLPVKSELQQLLTAL